MNNKSTKNIFFASILLLAISVLSSHALALTNERHSFDYKIENDEVEILSYHFNEERKAFIPATVEGLPVTKFRKGAFHDCVEVRLPESLTELWGNEFIDCPYLKCVIIPKSVNKIYIRTFDDCPKLKKLIFLGHPPEIRFSDYHDNCLIENKLPIYVPSNKGWENSIWNIAVLNTKMLILPDTAVSQFKYRQAENDAIALTELGKYVYYYSIPPYIKGRLVTEIDDSCFVFDGEEFGSSPIHIPHGVKKIGGNMYMPRFKGIEVDTKNKHFASLDSILFNKDMTRLICYPAGKNHDIRAYTIPKQVTEIGDHAFDGYNNLEAVNLPPRLLSIGKYAFANCKKFTYMYIPASVRFIHENAFKGCVKLSKIIFYGEPPLMDMSHFPTPCDWFVPKNRGWETVTPPKGIKLIIQ